MTHLGKEKIRSLLKKKAESSAGDHSALVSLNLLEKTVVSWSPSETFKCTQSLTQVAKLVHAAE